MNEASPFAGERNAVLVVFFALFSLYLISLAPDVTLWDAGEFNAAIASLGIPHPPGTPLYILIGRVWSRLLFFLPQAAAVNALSALSTALACALLARLLARWTRSVAAGVGAGITAGTMFAVWQNATETEVYALSLLLSVLLIVVGEKAGRSGRWAHRALLAYLMGLAVPLQISALVAAPAGIVLAATPAEGRRPTPSILASLGSAFLLVLGVGLGSPLFVLLGLLALVVTAALGLGRRGPSAALEPLVLAAVVLVGASATVYMLIRAAHDPGINQGNPSTWQAFTDVIARRQYDVPRLWPRRAPIWIQLGNLLQYADWQVASGLDHGVAPSWLRTPWSIVFGILSIMGARWHWRREKRSALALGLLLVSASLGVILVLNLRAGPSIGVGILARDAAHEPRERDYFFALAFAVAALWAGAGVVMLAQRLRTRGAVFGIAVAGLPALTNYAAANRRHEPDASLPRELGATVLESAPPRSVLLLAGDNDSYTTWYEQRVHGLRTDVTPVTIPLLGAAWYRAELARRDSLLSADEVRVWRGEESTLRAIAAASWRQGRAVSAAVSVRPEARRGLARRWLMRGLVLVAQQQNADNGSLDSIEDRVDVSMTKSIADRVESVLPQRGRALQGPAARYVESLLSCPRRTLRTTDSVGRRPRGAISCEREVSERASARPNFN